MLNQDIINDYLQNRDALNNSWGSFSLFGQPQAAAPSPGYANPFVPRPYTPESVYRIPEDVWASPSLSHMSFDPGALAGTGWDSTLADGYRPPTLKAYGKGLLDVASKISPTMIGLRGVGNLLGIGGGGDISVGGTGWGAPVSGGGYSGTTVDFGLDDPGSFDAPSFDPGGWGSGYGDGAY